MARLLLIDDDRETCRFMQELLTEPGREIDSAESPGGCAGPRSRPAASTSCSRTST